MIKIRAYQPADWPAVIAVHDAARPDELQGSCDPRAFVSLADDPEAEELQGSRILIAEVDEQVVGFSAVDGEYLGWLYLHPDHYRRGIGRLLLQASLDLIEGACWTIVLAGNTPAINLYHEQNFVVSDRFESDNAGFPCTCLRLTRKAS